MRIAKEGWPLILTAAALVLLALLFGWKAFGLVLAVLTIGVAAFFRDPERVIPSGDGLVVSPADGRVVAVAPIQGDGLFPDAVTRISIFLSPLDVHINRAPVAGRIDDVRYQAGKFLPAYNADAALYNEQNALRIVDERERNWGVVQIAGILARRIVCRSKAGDLLARGERFGLIMFGSRTDVYLPQGCRIEATEGQRVKGGETIIGRFP
ncbi:MAG TPA: phosphatidylserine decarboxylase family protein [Candidatus Binatia bacterium]|nr:phosphatidylserine decarboxylase family protein [Candidatus Binatia bacterium]